MDLREPIGILNSLKHELAKLYKEEAHSIAMLATEYLTGLNQTDILINKPIASNLNTRTRLEEVLSRLKKEEPIQYITGEAHFYGHVFEVNKDTLIPRPETEELVLMVSNEWKNKKDPISIIDIGTGSGCIPILLALELPNTSTLGVDISIKALNVARRNAQKLKANTQFESLDILSNDLEGSYDVIISNPPYVLDSEKLQMRNNVVEYEPEIALFVTDENPLLFYKRITSLAIGALNDGGMLYFEINENYGHKTKDLLTNYGFKNVRLLEDMYGKHRFVIGTKPPVI